MLTVHEVRDRTGVSVRTLHYYDEIGLLKPAQVTEAGYRLYDDEALRRLAAILFFRELEFPLKQIRSILNNPLFNRRAVLNDQLALLKLRKKHIEKLIVLAEKNMMEEGSVDMDFSAFDRTEMDQYAEEARERWGGTAAYEESRKKMQSYGKEDYDRLTADMGSVFAEFARLRGSDPTAPEAQAAVQKLQNLITDRCYTCTGEILAGLGEMYVADERFTKNIDLAGEGTAAFASAAIRAYCDK